MNREVHEFPRSRSVEDLLREARADAQNSGHPRLNLAINGGSPVEFRERAIAGASRLVERLESHEGNRAVVAALVETAEVDLRRADAQGVISVEDLRRALRGVGAHFHLEGTRNSEGRAFPRGLPAEAWDDVDPKELRQTLAGLAVADVLGRKRDGARIPAGSVTAALDAASRTAGSADEVRALGRVRAVVRAVRQNIRAVFQMIEERKTLREAEAASAESRRAGEAAAPDESRHDARSAPAPGGRTATQLRRSQRMVMCPPRFLDNKTPNNVFMDKSQPIDRERAMTQYRRVRTAIESFGVEVLEIPEQRGAQDQTFVANIAVSIDPYIVLANYKAPGRAIEVEPARRFFESLGYDCIQPPKYFEGEADLKHWKDNIYFGGIGQFSTENAFRWIEEKTGCEIILLEENNPECFHLDCSLSVIDEENVIVNPVGLSRASIEKLKSLVNVIEQPKGTDTTGITNSVRIPGKPVVLSGTLRGEKPDYRKAVEWLAKTYDEYGIVLWPVDTDAVDPSGADLSCTVMTLTF